MSPLTSEEMLKKLLVARGLKTASEQTKFLNPDYDNLYDPLTLPDIEPALGRIKLAQKNGEKVCIYGDYDVDGLTATALLLDAFKSFSIDTISYIPDRFSDGYGLSMKGVKAIAGQGVGLIITVDCGSKSHDEIKMANSLGVDVIVTDHHSPGEMLPKCVAVINPKRKDSQYPFNDLAGVGVAFKLVQALQTKLEGLELGQEKWLLDLVALGTTCDIVSITDENRVLVKWGLEVARKSRRPAFGALSSVSGTEKSEIDTETFGFRFGPRLNAAGRLLTAQKGLDLLTTDNALKAMAYAAELDTMNSERRGEQARIFEDASSEAQSSKDQVLVLSGKDWSQGIVGIVASKIVERFKKPAFILQNLGKETKGSARSFGDFHLAEALEELSDLTLKGGGHAMAAGVTLKSSDAGAFRKKINQYYQGLGLKNQSRFLEAKPEITLEDLSSVSEELVKVLSKLEPFGSGNPKPVFESKLEVVEARAVGTEGVHLKALLSDEKGNQIDAIGFGLARDFDFALNSATVKYRVGLNTFNKNTKVQLELLQITPL